MLVRTVLATGIAFGLTAFTAPRAAGQPADASRPPVMGAYRAAWMELPDAEAQSRAYPAAAARRGLSGEVRVRCRVAADGGLVGCVVLSETPAGEGFGEAALKLAPDFRMIPPEVSSPDGPLVTIPIKFTLPSEPTTPSPPTARKTPVVARPGPLFVAAPFAGAAVAAGLLWILFLTVGRGRRR